MQVVPTIDQIKALIPEDLWNQTVVAGGFAANPQKAHDVDIWVLTPNREDPHGLATELEAHLTGVPWVADPELDHSDYQDPMLAEILLVRAGRMEPSKAPFHLLVAEVVTLTALLGLFDLDCHARGYYLNTPLEWVQYPIGDPLGPIDLVGGPNGRAPNAPLATLTRLIRFSKRYDRPMNWALARRLLAEAEAIEAVTPRGQEEQEVDTFGAADFDFRPLVRPEFGTPVALVI